MAVETVVTSVPVDALMEDVNIPACCLIKHQNTTLILPQHRPGQTEKLSLAMAEVQVFDQHIQWMRILTLIALADDNVP